MERLQTALEDAGMIFIDADEEGPGVRLKANQPGQCGRQNHGLTAPRRYPWDRHR